MAITTLTTATRTLVVAVAVHLVLTARWYLLHDNDRTEGTMMFTFGGGGRVSL